MLHEAFLPVLSWARLSGQAAADSHVARVHEQTCLLQPGGWSLGREGARGRRGHPAEEGWAPVSILMEQRREGYVTCPIIRHLCPPSHGTAKVGASEDDTQSPSDGCGTDHCGSSRAGCDSSLGSKGHRGHRHALGPRELWLLPATWSLSRDDP